MPNFILLQQTSCESIFGARRLIHFLSGSGEIVLIDAQGKICKTWQLPELSRPVQLNATGLRAGAYVVCVRAGDGVIFGKL